MRAEVLAVGSELLRPPRTDTNAPYISRRLEESGVEVVARSIVCDDLGVLTSALRSALDRSEFVIATGGLGPTEDDLTRQAAAGALGIALKRQENLVAQLRERFARYGRVMAPVNERQADVLEGATVLPNARGTAPGQLIEVAGRVLVLLPGPPGEMEPMFDTEVLPRVVSRAGPLFLRTRVLRIAGMSESDVEERVAPVYKAFVNPRTTILGGAGDVELHFTAQASSEAEAEARVEELAARVRELLPGRIYTEDGRELVEVVASLLLSRGFSISVAESCTGGLLAARLTSVPGSSGYLQSGFVTYSDRSKVELLGIDASLLESVGAVSEEVALAMAEGARLRASASIGVGITGIAGPGGGSEAKPVGLVFLAIDGEAGRRVRRARFPGDRSRVRRQAVQAALEMIRRGLLGLAP